ncbi:MAG: GNAT family N-acetyltransferase [Fuerstiella sp.]
MSDVHLKLEPNLGVDEFISVLNRSTLAERRPVDDIQQIEGMLKHADVIATARNFAGTLIGVSRCLTDFHYSTYLSDLAVDVDYQRQGIGKRMVEFCHQQAGLHTSLILLAAPAAETYYGKIGMQQHPSCWLIRAKTN